MPEGGALYAVQICQIIPTLMRAVFSCVLEKSGMQAVKWLYGLIMNQNEAYLAIFCTLKTTSGFIFLLPVVRSDLATNGKPVGLVSKAIPAHL